MDLKLSGKTVLITGGSKGIGFACAMAFAAEGCAVHIASRSKETLEAARDKIRARHNVPVEIHVADFSKGDTVRSRGRGGGPCRHPGEQRRRHPARRHPPMTEPKWREAWELKVFGYINATRAMLEKMYARKKGVVVNIIGLAGESFNYDYVAGTMANAGLMAFTRAVGSKSVDHGVRVVAINPPAPAPTACDPAARPGRAAVRRSRALARAHQAHAVRPAGRARRGGRSRGVPGVGSRQLYQRRGDDAGGGQAARH